MGDPCTAGPFGEDDRVYRSCLIVPVRPNHIRIGTECWSLQHMFGTSSRQGAQVVRLPYRVSQNGEK